MIKILLLFKLIHKRNISNIIYLLKEQMRTQIDKNGFHKSNNPSYQAEFINNLHEIKIKEKQGVDAIFLASLFNKKMTYLGIERFKILKNQTKLKIIALGGLNQNNIKKLKLLNVFGFAAISFFKEAKKNGPYTNKGRLNFLVLLLS